MVVKRILALLFVAASARAQLAMGHVQLNVSDMSVQKSFWTGIIGAKLFARNGLEGVEVTGALIVFTHKEPSGGSVGTPVDHIGFLVPDLSFFPDRVTAAGYKFIKPAGVAQMLIDGPGGVKVELSEDKAETTPLRFHHVHFLIPSAKDAQTWYAEKFGAVPGHRSRWDAGDIPGANLTFQQADKPTVPTAGRAIDHIGFEVSGLEAFCKTLEAGGVTLDEGYRRHAGSFSTAVLTDPWGTRIELTEGLK